MSMSEKTQRLDDITLAPEIIKESPFRMPRVPAKFDIVLGYHATGDDLDYDETRAIIAGADIVLLESVGWTAEELTTVRGIARKGIEGMYGLSSYSMKMGSVISKTNATYHFWDPNVDTQTRDEWRSYYAGKDPGLDWTNVTNIDEYRQKLELKCERTIIRDKLALKELSKKIDTLAPKKYSKPISVVMIAGVMHQVLAQRVAMSQDDTHSVSYTQPLVDDPPTMYIRRKIAGNTMSDTELMGMLLMDIFIQKYAGQDMPTEPILELAHEELAKLSTLEITDAANMWFEHIGTMREKAAEYKSRQRQTALGRQAVQRGYK